MAIHLDVSQTRLDRVLQTLYRGLGILWLIKGFYGWAILTGVTGGGVAAFDTVMVLRVIFSVLDLIAGVSLWMSWRWGSGVWFIVAFSYAILGIGMFPEFSGKASSIFVLLLTIIHFGRVILIRAVPEKRLTIV